MGIKQNINAKNDNLKIPKTQTTVVQSLGFEI